MDITLQIRVEEADDGEVVWWATADELEGFSAAASTLTELRRNVRNVLQEITDMTPLIHEHLKG